MEATEEYKKATLGCVARGPTLCDYSKFALDSSALLMEDLTSKPNSITWTKLFQVELPFVVEFYQ